MAVPNGFHKARHVKFWQRCHGNYLPSSYTSIDSSRITFAFFIVSAFDLLSIPLSGEDRKAIRSWVLSLQHPDGGFCGSPSHARPGLATANLAATFFAILMLAVAADSEDEARAAFSEVYRSKLLLWLRRLQRSDGTFGQVLWDDKPMGGRDMRHSYLASCIRWMLRGNIEPGDPAWVQDVDIDAMVSYIRTAQTYDGGLAEASEQESHAGYAYCGVAALHMLDRPTSPSHAMGQDTTLGQGIADRGALINFLAQRQFEYLALQEEEDGGEDDNYIVSESTKVFSSRDCRYVGYNGRWNKKADTCYCWWVAGTLTLLGNKSLVNVPLSRQYILDITQHQIGGFSKSVGGIPDIFHSYLGLCALAVMGEPELKDFDVGLCCSQHTRNKIDLAREWLVGRTRPSAVAAMEGDTFWDRISKNEESKVGRG